MFILITMNQKLYTSNKIKCEISKNYYKFINWKNILSVCASYYIVFLLFLKANALPFNKQIVYQFAQLVIKKGWFFVSARRLLNIYYLSLIKKSTKNFISLIHQFSANAVRRSYKSSVGLGENKVSIRLQALNKTLSTYWLTLTRHPERPAALFESSEPHQVCSFKQVSPLR